jgi:predicted PilT family ATPase
MLQHELLERVAAFQGIGKTPHAVDASQLLGVIQEFRKVWKVSEKFPQLIGGAPDEIKAIEKHINLIMRYGSTRIEERRKRIAEQSKLVVAELGKNFDKNELLKDLEEVCVLSEQRGLRGEISVEQIRKLAEKFNKTLRLRDVSEQVENIVLSDDLPTRMTAIARLETQTHSLLVEFSDTCSKFLQERAGKAQGQILAWTEEVVEMKKAEVESILNELENAVVPFGEENE